jgi:uncharacterized phage-associated protein
MDTEKQALTCDPRLLFETSHEKTTQALNYLAVKSDGAIDRMKALKLIFFADRYHLRKYGRPVTGDTYWAMKRGPVASLAANLAAYDTCSSEFLEDAERDYAATFLTPGPEFLVASKQPVDRDVFSATDLEALDFAWAEFGKLPSWQLYRVTHAYPEWRKRSAGLETGRQTRAAMAYADFFLDADPQDPDLQSLGGRDPFEHATTAGEKELAFELAEERSAVLAFWDR